MLSSLVYVSTRNPNCTDLEIEKILQSCQKNNLGLDITGVLLYSSSHFIQYLEGELKLIYSLYDKIKADDRHSDIALIANKPIENRLFPSWQMGSKKFEEDEISFLTDIDESEKKQFQNILSGKEDERAIALFQKFSKRLVPTSSTL